MRKGEAEGFGDDLRGRGGAEETGSPPPGVAQARPADLGGVFEGDLMLSEAGADGKQCDATGDETLGKGPEEARAIIIAGRPLSQVATPRTPVRVGSERMRRRRTMAASLRKGRESSIPVVPCVRPSQGSVQAPANGTARRALSSRAASATRAPTSQCPV